LPSICEHLINKLSGKKEIAMGIFAFMLNVEMRTDGNRELQRAQAKLPAFQMRGLFNAT